MNAYSTTLLFHLNHVTPIGLQHGLSNHNGKQSIYVHIGSGGLPVQFKTEIELGANISPDHYIQDGFLDCEKLFTDHPNPKFICTESYEGSLTFNPNIAAKGQVINGLVTFDDFSHEENLTIAREVVHFCHRVEFLRTLGFGEQVLQDIHADSSQTNKSLSDDVRLAVKVFLGFFDLSVTPSVEIFDIRLMGQNSIKLNIIIDSEYYNSNDNSNYVSVNATMLLDVDYDTKTLKCSKVLNTLAEFIVFDDSKGDYFILNIDDWFADHHNIKDTSAILDMEKFNRAIEELATSSAVMQALPVKLFEF